MKILKETDNIRFVSYLDYAEYFKDQEPTETITYKKPNGTNFVLPVWNGKALMRVNDVYKLLEDPHTCWIKNIL